MKFIFDVSNSQKKRIKKGSHKVIMFLIPLIIIFQVLACQSFIQTDSRKSIPENLQVSKPQKNVEEKQPNNFRVIDPNFERNRRLWDEKKITNYNITVEASEGGNITYPSPALIKVRDEKAVSTSVNSKSDEDLRERYKKIDTVTKMFDIIQRGFENEAKVEVKYNKTFGYPEDISVNNFKRGVDSWVIIKIKEFEEIK